MMALTQDAFFAPVVLSVQVIAIYLIVIQLGTKQVPYNLALVYLFVKLKQVVMSILLLVCVVQNGTFS